MKAFRQFTDRIPLYDPTVVMHSPSIGFANTVREKINLARSVRSYSPLYIAWPGKFETHVFQATPAEVLAVLTDPQDAVLERQAAEITRLRTELASMQSANKAIRRSK